MSMSMFWSLIRACVGVLACVATIVILIALGAASWGAWTEYRSEQDAQWEELRLNTPSGETISLRQDMSKDELVDALSSLLKATRQDCTPD